jgi:hypothetical protein
VTLKDWIPLIAAGIALGGVALGQALGYQLALASEQRKWSRDRRTEVYLDALNIITERQLDVAAAFVDPGPRPTEKLDLLRNRMLAFASAEVYNAFGKALAAQISVDEEAGELRQRYLGTQSALVSAIRQELVGKKQAYIPPERLTYRPPFARTRSSASSAAASASRRSVTSSSSEGYDRLQPQAKHLGAVAISGDPQRALVRAHPGRLLCSGVHRRSYDYRFATREERARRTSPC